MKWKLPSIKIGTVNLWSVWGFDLGSILNMRGGGLIRVGSTPSGPRLEVDKPKRRFVKLIGSASPYTGTLVYPATGGGWADEPSSPTFSNIHEVSGFAGLSGKVVEIRPEQDRWLCEFVKEGGIAYPPPPCDIEVTIKVVGCHFNPVPSAIVRIKQGATVLGTATADIGGYATITISAPSFPFDFEIQSDPILGYAGRLAPGYRLWNCVGDISVDFLVIPDEDHVCVPCCNHPAPREVEIAFAGATGVLTYDEYGWVGPVTFTVPTACSGESSDCDCPPPYEFAGGVLATRTSQSVTIQPILRCLPGTNVWVLETWDLPFYGAWTDCDGNPSWCTVTSFIGLVELSYPFPDVQIELTGNCDDGVFALSGTIPDPNPFDIDGLYGQPVCPPHFPPPATITMNPTYPLSGPVTIVGL